MNLINNLAFRNQKTSADSATNFDRKIYKKTISDLLMVLNARNRAIIQKKYLEEKPNKTIIKELKINPAVHWHSHTEGISQDASITHCCRYFKRNDILIICLFS